MFSPFAIAAVGFVAVVVGLAKGEGIVDSLQTAEPQSGQSEVPWLYIIILGIIVLFLVIASVAACIFCCRQRVSSHRLNAAGGTSGITGRPLCAECGKLLDAEE